MDDLGRVGRATKCVCKVETCSLSNARHVREKIAGLIAHNNAAVAAVADGWGVLQERERGVMR